MRWRPVIASAALVLATGVGLLGTGALGRAAVHPSGTVAARPRLPHALANPSPLPVTNVTPCPGGAAGQVGLPFNWTLAATGGGPTYTWSASPLPPGLEQPVLLTEALDGSTGLLRGTPTRAGTTDVTITVTSNGYRSPKPCRFEFLPRAGGPATPRPTPARTGKKPAYSFKLTNKGADLGIDFGAFKLDFGYDWSKSTPSSTSTTATAQSPDRQTSLSLQVTQPPSLAGSPSSAVARAVNAVHPVTRGAPGTCQVGAYTGVCELASLPGSAGRLWVVGVRHGPQLLIAVARIRPGATARDLLELGMALGSLSPSP